MTSKLNFRSIVFKRAYQLKRQNGISFSAALKLAWIRYREYKTRIVEEIAKKINNFDFNWVYSDDYRTGQYWRSVSDKLHSELSFNACFIGSIASSLNNPKDIKSFI